MFVPLNGGWRQNVIFCFREGHLRLKRDDVDLGGEPEEVDSDTNLATSADDTTYADGVQDIVEVGARMCKLDAVRCISSETPAPLAVDSR